LIEQGLTSPPTQ